MKVAVVGLLDRQHALISPRQYPHLQLRFASKGAKHSQTQSAMLNEVDRVLVMAKFISHSTTVALDRSKTTLIHGGLSQLKDRLASLNQVAALHHRPQPTPPPPANDDTESDMSDTEEEAVRHLDFKALRTAKVGDVLVFTRPPRLPLRQWELRISQARSYYLRMYNVHTEVQYRDGEAHIRVLPPPEPKLAQDTVATPEPHDVATQPAPESYDVGQLWREVLTHRMHLCPNESAEDVVTYVNTLVDAYLQRFGHVPPSTPA